MKKPNPELLARVESRKISRVLDDAMEDVTYYNDWRHQIAYYREQAEKLPDERSSPIWTAASEIGKRGREYLEAEGAAKTEIDGTLHYQTGSKETPRARLEDHIDQAEQAATNGDIGRFGVLVSQIVTALHNAQLPTIERSLKSAAASKSARHERPNRQGTLLKIIRALGANSTDEVYAAFENGENVSIDGRDVRLKYLEGFKKAYHAAGECWSRANIASKISLAKRKG